MEEMEQRHVVIVGAGIMGASLAQVYAQGGWQVSLYNRSQKGLDRARGTVLKNQELLCAQGMLAPEEAAQAVGRITFTLDRDCMGSCALMLETIVEDLEAKRIFWQEASPRRRPCWPPIPAVCPSARLPRRCTGRSGSWASTGSIRRI